MQKKPLTKFSTHLWLKLFKKWAYKNLPQHSKGHIWWAYSKHYSQWWKTESTPPKIRNKTKVSTFTTIIQHSSGNPSNSIQRRKRNKSNPDWKSESEVAQLCPTLCDCMDWLWPTRLLGPWDFPGKNTGVGCHFLLQETFQTQGLNPCLPHYRQTLYRLSHQGSPRLEKKK